MNTIPFSPRQVKFIAIIAGLVVVALFGMWYGLRVVGKKTEVTLTVWGTPEEQSAVEGAAGNFHPSDPSLSVQINYVSIPSSDYEAQLLNRLAEGNPVDVVMIQNRWIPQHKNKLIPLDPRSFSPTKMADLFPQVVADDLTATEGVYAFPLYIDTLVLLYNKDLFDQAGIVRPPATWKEFQNAVSSLRSVNAQGQIVRAGAAIGGSEKTVVNAADLLQLLMMQNGSAMVDRASGAVSFDRPPPGETSSLSQTPATDAFDFYVQFANAGSPYYTWNENQNSSLDSFASGKAAMAFAYQSQIAQVVAKNPYLRFGVAPMPQVSDTAFTTKNYAHYWALAVSKQSAMPNIAWDFANYMATDGAVAYASLAGHPPALRSQIAALEDDPSLGIFARQALTARSWYEVDSAKIQAIFNNAISQVLTGRVSTRDATAQIQQQVGALAR